jgi:hypothetical protein
MKSWIAMSAILFVAIACAPFVRAQDDVADVPNQDLRVAGNEQQRYFLIGAKDGRCVRQHPGGDAVA